MNLLQQHIESLIFTAEKSITRKEINKVLGDQYDGKVPAKDVDAALEQLLSKYADEHYAFEIVEINQGYQFMTKAIFHPTVGSYLKWTNRKRLSKAALETLAIIAYKQPLTRLDVESIRGVNCDYTLQKLLEKELVEIAGRSEGPGRPLLYATSAKFMDYFGLKDISHMPKPKDLENVENQIGEPAPIEEVVGTPSSEEE